MAQLAFLTSHQDISGKENTSNKVTSWTSTTIDAHYLSEKLVKTTLDDKANSSHTYSYVGSSSAGSSATSAVKLDTAMASSATQQVYFSGCKSVACTSYANATVKNAMGLYVDNTGIPITFVTS